MSLWKRVVTIIVCIAMAISSLPNMVYASEISDSKMNLLTENSTSNSVLIVRNKQPWNSTAEETVLGSLGISYDIKTIEQTSSLDFNDYKLVFISNDQEDAFYRQLSNIRTKLELFVMNGGTLLYGICDAGWGNGESDLLIPGDVELGPVTYMNNNYIVNHDHPIISGVLTDNSPLTDSLLHNNHASHRYFVSSTLPEDTMVIIKAGEGMPTLVEYPIGNGVVLASTLTWEHSFDREGDSPFGKRSFDDLILYAYTVSQITSALENSSSLGFNDYINGLTCTAGDPVNVANGNFVSSVTDLSFEGQISLSFSRYYNSLDDYDGILGKNWRSNNTVELKKLSNRRYRLYRGDGGSEDFVFGDDGVWYETPGTNSKIKSEDDRLIITLSNKVVYTFDTQQRLLSVKQPFASEEVYEYNENGLLSKTSQAGFSISYFYENGYLTKITDNAGRSVIYCYEGDKLVSVEKYDESKTSYKYDEKGLMISLVVNGYTINNEYDEFGRVTSQEMIDEGKCSFVYDDENLTTTFIDKNGLKTVYYKDVYGRIYKVVSGDGEEIKEFSSENKILSLTDKAGSRTLYQYDGNGNCISVTNALGNTAKYEYDESGNTTAFIDAEGNRVEATYAGNNVLTSSDAYGNTTTFSYDENNQITKITLPNNGEYSFEYDGNGNIVKETDPEGITETFAYNDLNQIIESIDGNGNRVRYEYIDFGKNVKEIYDDGTYTISEFDFNDNLVSFTDELGNTEKYFYNSIGLLTGVENAAGYTISYEYDCMNNVKSFTNWNGLKSEYFYDEYGNMTKMTDAEGNSTMFEYDVIGNVIKETDANGNTKSYEYDALGRMVKSVDGNGNTITQVFSPNGNLISKINGNGNAVKYEYDKNNQVIKEINELGEETSYQYDVMGNPIVGTNCNGDTIKYQYDRNNHITKIILPDHNEMHINYDAVGNIISYVEPNGATTRFEYDLKGNLIKETNALNYSRLYGYNAKGNNTSITDENGNTTKYEYDAVNNITKVIDATGNETWYKYNGNNDVIEMIQNLQVQSDTINTMKKSRGASYNSNSELIVTQYSYDAKGRLVSEISPMGKKIEYAYDAIGNLKSKLDADNILTKYEYDAAGNLISIAYGDGKTVQYEYNANNVITCMTDWNGKTTYEVDALGRITSVTDAMNRTVSYKWNGNGEKSQIIYADGSTVDYKYNNRDLLAEVYDSVLGKTVYTYDINGNLVKTVEPNGISSVNEYDTLSRLVKKTDYDKNGKAIDEYKYSYDGVGNKVQIDRDKKLSTLEKLSDSENGVTNYSYDSLNRLVLQKNSKKETEKYFYDTLGNRVRKETWASSLFVTAADFKYNEDGQLTSVEGALELVYGTMAVTPVHLNYDNRGNLIDVSQLKKSIYLFNFDETNRMVSSKNALGIETNYCYDGNGTRISKTVNFPKNANGLKASIRKEICNLVSDWFDVKITDLNKSYEIDYLSDVTSDYNDVLAVSGDTLKSTRFTYGNGLIGASSNCQNVFYLTDDQGTPVKLINASGKVIQKYSFDEYGNPELGSFVNSVLGKNSTIGYAGYQYDVETGLYYVQARYYNSITASFISKDIVRGYTDCVQTLNRYTYCLNNPILFIDPSGCYTYLEGKVAHLVLQTYFMLYYGTFKTGKWTPKVEYTIYGVEGNLSGIGYADMVLLREEQQIDVYEIKPISYNPKSVVYNEKGKTQLTGYVDALNRRNRPAKRGVEFQRVINNKMFPYPLNPSKVIIFYTYPSDPGMIYYAITKPDPKKAYAKDADKVAELVYRKVVNGEKKTNKDQVQYGESRYNPFIIHPEYICQGIDTMLKMTMAAIIAAGAALLSLSKLGVIP